MVLEKNVGKAYISVEDLKQGFPTWGSCTHRGTFAYMKGYI